MRRVRRLAAALVASLLLVGAIAPAVGVARVSAANTSNATTAVPKVVIIVGPAGSATDGYRAEAVRAAAVARNYTPDVTELYSPNATWPAVRTALQGASLVIYMGHGNGWPSRYRDGLYPPTQNGFGLNPKAGDDDAAHQYFGESRIAASIRLAPDAVVLLNHLCYASGNTEPGLPEGTIDQARQRVDNFAAGFIKAGAAAVVAEAWSSPDYMIRSILGRSTPIERAWKNAPTRNGNTFAFASTRSPGFVGQMDPETSDSGFTRSIVLKAGLAPADVLRGARGTSTPNGTLDAIGLTPTLAAAGITAKAPTLGSTAASSTITYRVPVSIAHRRALPRTIMASVRWDPLDPTWAAATDPGSTDSGITDPTDHTGPTDLPTAPADPTTTDPADHATPDTADPATAPAEPATEPDPATPPDLGLVTPERIGDVVAPVKIKQSKGAFTFKVVTPAVPGRYRLTVTLHDGDGVAYDAATQALLPTLLVRVTGAIDAEIVAPASMDLAPGSVSDLPLWVANLGSSGWGQAAGPGKVDPSIIGPASSATVTGRWVALGGSDATAASDSAAAASTRQAVLPAGMQPGAIVGADLQVFAPTVPEDYLLILDVVAPEIGSLTAQGVEPTIIRVHVAVPTPALTPNRPS